ncbi:hypothetical protein ACFVWN_01100 [Nocardiopsis flavescens]|uniref:glycoside hydrolase family 78 protein n=1 Tax=Nocardiopsis flavescens TaxID=758803 RepID=UPI0036463406
MTVTIVLGSPTDGYLESAHTSYATALNGANLAVPGNSAPLMYWGQGLGSGVRYIRQAFVGFGWTADTGATPVAAYLRLQAAQTTVTGTVRDLEVRAHDWGASVNTADWRTPTQLNAAPLRGRVLTANTAGAQVMRAGLDLGEVATTGTKRYVLASSRNRLQQGPTGLEWQTVRQAAAANPAGQRPALYVTSTTKHRLDSSLGAQVQLTDGTTLLAEQSAPAPGPLTLSLIHHDGTAPTTIDTVASPAGRTGAQAFALARDTSDTVYLLYSGSAANQVVVRAWQRTGPAAWSPVPERTVVLPTYERRVNNLAAAWHPQGGTAGTLVVVAAREAGPTAGSPLSYALVSCDHVLTGAGAALRGAGNADGTVVDASAADGHGNFPNETGSLLDVCAVRDTSGGVSDRGFVLCSAKHQVLGSSSRQSIGRYQLNTAGTTITTTRTLDTVSGFSVKDADAKSRILPVSVSQCVTVNASTSAEFGLVVKHRQQFPGSSDWTVLADVRLDAQSIASMPAPATLATTSTWDAAYDPVAHLVWVYYLDAANPRRLMKTHIDLNTGLAARDEIEVAADIGPAESTNRALRLHRGESVGQQVVITLANQGNGGVHNTLYVVEEVNLPPDAPVLGPRTNFDAADAVLFTWTFRDPRPADTQSAFQLQIFDDLTDTLIHDTGKTASAPSSHEVAAATLTNGEAYRWRVRTWDTSNEVGPFSGFGFFACSTAGNATITYPPTDLPADLQTADLQIEWEVTGAFQDEYRVRVVRTGYGTVHSDTGWVPSTSTTHLVTGLASEVEYRVEVTTRDTSVSSSTGTRLVRPDYTSPVPPLASVVAVEEGAHLRVEITNPTPGEILSLLDGTFEDTTEGWTADPATSAQLTRTDEQAHDGAWAARIEVHGAPALAGIRPEPAWRAEAEPHRRYTLSMWAYSPSGPTTLRSTIDFYDEHGTLLGSSWAEDPIDGGHWALVNHTASAPAGTVDAGYGPSLVSPGDGTLLYVDGIELRTATDVPVPHTNEVWRAHRGGPPLLVGIAPAGEPFRDYLTGSSRDYIYTVRALAPDGATADSAPAAGSVYFEGVWLHDPAAPETTLLQYRFGRSARSDTTEVDQIQHQFLGRELPVTAFGDTRTDVWQVTVTIPEGADRMEATDSLRAWNLARRPLVCRDNRGRVWVGTLDSLNVDDQDLGDSVAFTVTRISSDLPGGER